MARQTFRCGARSESTERGASSDFMSAAGTSRLDLHTDERGSR
jgi:hypothetical protein